MLSNENSYLSGLYGTPKTAALKKNKPAIKTALLDNIFLSGIECFEEKWKNLNDDVSADIRGFYTKTFQYRWPISAPISVPSYDTPGNLELWTIWIISLRFSAQKDILAIWIAIWKEFN